MWRAGRGELGEAFARLDACGADAELVALCKRCLAPDPADRPGDGKAVADAVAAYRAGVEERARKAEADRAAAAAEAHEQRKRRKVQLALAGAVALLLAAAAAFAWWENEQANRRDRDTALLAQERGFKAEQARQGVASNLALATDLRKQYRFKEAGDALTQAAKLAEGAPELAPHVEHAQDDLAFVVRLDDIRFRKWVWVAEAGGTGHFSTNVAPPEYRRAFAERNRSLTDLPTAEVASWIAASGAKAELVAAVDDWATYEPDTAVRDRLLEVARRADPHPWTDRLRDPATRGDKAAVQKLAAEADPARTAPAATVVLVTLMDRLRLDGRGVLLAARVAHPSEFELAFALGQFSKDAQQVGPYEAARALRPDNRTGWNNLGAALHETKDVDGAVAALRRAIDLDPTFAAAHMNLGVVLHGKKDLGGAVAAYTKAIELDPTFATAHNNLGVLQHGKKDVDGAVAAYRKAIELDPANPVAHVNLGIALRDKKELDGAVAALRKAIELDPSFAAAHMNLGNALHDKKDLDGAVAAYQKAIDLLPKYAEAHNNLGNALLSKKDADGAVAAFGRAIKADPNYAVAHYNLGLALHDKKQVDGAVAAFGRAVELEPRNADAHIHLGLALADKKDVSGATAAYRRATEVDPRASAAHSFLGLMYFQQKNYTGAISSLRTAIGLNPGLASDHAILGMSLLQTGDGPGARAALREAVRLDPKRWAPLLSKYLASYEPAPPPREIRR